MPAKKTKSTNVQPTITKKVVKKAKVSSKKQPRKIASVKKKTSKKPVIKKSVSQKSPVAVQKQTVLKSKTTEPAQKNPKPTKIKKRSWFYPVLIFATFGLAFLFIIKITLVKAPHYIISSEQNKPDETWITLQEDNQEEIVVKIDDREESEEEEVVDTTPPEEEEISPPLEAAITQPITITILNGSGIKGRAKLFRQKLTNDQIEVSQVGNADSFNYPDTIIKYPIEKLDDALVVKETFDNLNLKYSLKEGFDIDQVTVIIGKDNL